MYDDTTTIPTRPRITEPGCPPWDRINDRENYSQWLKFLQRRIALVGGIMNEHADSVMLEAAADLLQEIQRDLGPVVEFAEQAEQVLDDMGHQLARELS